MGVIVVQARPIRENAIALDLLVRKAVLGVSLLFDPFVGML
ncbi:MAG: hypothetical protein KatS3mg115_0442 [Candidatus Poribacteria bacterium]|nr:MAG: hypothetical protein KatS3mg115_0442 [Candidatus Poribacteria bacterium]